MALTGFQQIQGLSAPPAPAARPRVPAPPPPSIFIPSAFQGVSLNPQGKPFRNPVRQGQSLFNQTQGASDWAQAALPAPDAYQQLMQEINRNPLRFGLTGDQYERGDEYSSSRSSTGSSRSDTSTAADEARERAEALESDDKFFGGIFSGIGKGIKKVPGVGPTLDLAWDIVDEPLAKAMPWIDKPGAVVRNTIAEISDAVAGTGDGTFDLDDLWEGIKTNRGSAELLYDRGVDNVWQRRLLGFTGDIGTDPFSWATVGAIGGAKGGATAAGRAMRIAEKLPEGTLRNQLIDTAQTVTKYSGGSRLSKVQVEQLATLDKAERIAARYAGEASDITIMSVYDDILSGGVRFGDDFAGLSTPTALKGGARLNVPLTGRPTQRVVNRLTGNKGNALTGGAKTIPVAPQWAVKYTPRGMWQGSRRLTAGAADRNIVGLGTVRGLLGGDKQAMKQLVRTGSRTEAFDAWHTFHSTVEGTTRGGRWSNDQMRAGVQLVEEVGLDNEDLILPALNGSQEAIDALGPENWAKVQAWRTQFRQSANEAAGSVEGSEFIKEMSTWAPWKISDDLRAILDDAGDNLTPELAELRRGASDPKAKAAKIAPGRKYFGEEIYAYGDPAAPNGRRGLTPREQADEILAGVLERNGVDFDGKVFSDNFTDSVIANVVHVSDQIGEVYTINRLTEAGVAIDLNDLAVTKNIEARNHARIAVDAARDKLSRTRGVKAEWARRARSQAEDLKRQTDDEWYRRRAPVEKAERWKNSVDKYVARADTQLKAAARAADEITEEMPLAREATVGQLQGRLAKLETSRGQVTREANRLVTRRNGLITDINKLHEEIAKAPKNARSEVMAKGKVIAKKRQELARIHQQEAAMREVMKVNYSEIDRNRTLIGAAQEQIDELKATRKDLPTRGSSGRNVEARAAAREIDNKIAVLENHKAAAEEFIEAVDGVISDLPGGTATGAYFRDMARQADSIERLEGMLGLPEGSITPQVADQMYRDLIENPGSQLRRQLDEAHAALGRDAELLDADIEALVKEANVPEAVQLENGDVIMQNRRNPENQWAHVEETSTGPVLGQKTTDKPLLTGDDVYDLKTGRKKPESRRWQIRGERTKTFYGGKASRDVDMLETAFQGGLQPNASWGPGWEAWAEVAEKVKGGRRLNTSIREVMPSSGWDYHRAVGQLLDGPALSGWQRRRVREMFRDKLKAEGFDSHSWVDPEGNWSLVPNNRNQLVKHLEDLPEGPAQTLTQYADEAVERMEDTIHHKARAAEELGADIETLNGRIENMEAYKIDLEDTIEEVSRQFDEAWAAKKADAAGDLDARLVAYEDALSLQERADFHLQRMEELQANGADAFDIQVEANMAEVARLEGIAKKIETDKYPPFKPLRDAEKNAAKELKRAQKEMAKAEAFGKKLAAMDEATWKATLGSGWKQVGWNSDRAIPRNIAEALNARTTLSDKSMFVKRYDAAMKVWRGMATTSPGFHFRNFLGGVINNMHADVNPAMYPLWRKMERTLEDFTHGGGNVKRRIPGMKGDILDPDTALNLAAARMRAKGDFRFELPNGEIYKGKGLGMNADAVDAWQRIKQSGVAEGGQFDELGISHLRAQHRRQTANPFSKDFAIYRASRNLGGSVENNLRGPLALDTMLKGGGIDSAIDMVHKFHFDYGDLSNFERNKLHRAMSFYTWTRKNLPLQLEMIFDNPRVFNRYQHLQRNLEVGQEEQDVMASWVDKTTALRLPWGAGDFYLTPDVPFKEITQTLDPMSIIAGSAPPIKLALEHYAGRSSFTNAPFEGEFQALGPGLAWMFDPLEAMGKATETEDGVQVVNKGTFNVLTGLLPALSVAHRLHPPIRDEDSDGPNYGRRTKEQQGSSILSYAFGIGSYVATPTEKRNALIAPAFDLQKEADRLRKLGREDEAQEYYDGAQYIFDDVDEQYPRPGR